MRNVEGYRLAEARVLGWRDGRADVAEERAAARESWVADAAAYLRELVDAELIGPCEVHDEREPACGPCALFFDLVDLVDRSEV